jgi:hypothetical protein
MLHYAFIVLELSRKMSWPRKIVSSNFIMQENQTVKDPKVGAKFSSTA